MIRNSQTLTSANEKYKYLAMEPKLVNGLLVANDLKGEIKTVRVS